MLDRPALSARPVLPSLQDRHCDPEGMPTVCRHSALTPPHSLTVRTPRARLPPAAGAGAKYLWKARALLLPGLRRGWNKPTRCLPGGRAGWGGEGCCQASARLGLGAQAQLSPQLTGQLGRRRDPLAEMGNPRAVTIQQCPLALTCPLATSRPPSMFPWADRETPARRGPPPLLPAAPHSSPGFPARLGDYANPGGSLIKSLTRRWGRARAALKAGVTLRRGPGPSATEAPHFARGLGTAGRRRGVLAGPATASSGWRFSPGGAGAPAARSAARRPGAAGVGGGAAGAAAPSPPFRRLLLGQQPGLRPPERPGLANISGPLSGARGRPSCRPAPAAGRTGAGEGRGDRGRGSGGSRAGPLAAGPRPSASPHPSTPGSGLRACPLGSRGVTPGRRWALGAHPAEPSLLPGIRGSTGRAPDPFRPKQSLRSGGKARRPGRGSHSSWNSCRPAPPLLPPGASPGRRAAFSLLSASPPAGGS